MEKITIMEATTQGRIKWLDSIRGIAFLMVIYCHLEYHNVWVMKFFTPIFLTSFFFVSGYLFKENKPFVDVFEQRTRTLLLPFLIFGFFLIILSHILTFNNEVSWVDGFKGLLYQNGKNQLIWFIAALYVYSIFFYWVERFCKSENTLLGVSFILFLLNVIYKYWLQFPNVPWHIDSMGYACFYMALGKWYRHNEDKLDVFFHSRIILLLSIIYITAIWFFNLKISFSGSKYAIDALIITLLGLIICIKISKLYLCNMKLINFIGANTLFYFSFHGKVYSLLQMIYNHEIEILDIEHNIIMDQCSSVIIVFLDALILIIPAMIVNRYCPQLLGKGFKLWRK